jgi:hypothetical protein
MEVVCSGSIDLRTIASESKIWMYFGGRIVPGMTWGSFVLSRRQWISTSVLIPVDRV